MGRDESDGTIIERSQTKPARFADLFDRHYGAVYAFCARRLAPSDVDDAVSETFRRAFEYRARFETDRDDARPWLYGIALNVIRVGQRSFTREARATARESSLLRIADDPYRASAEALDAERDLAAVARVLPDLPVDELDVLLLFVWDELTYDEIAEALGIPTGTVRSRLARARSRLREALRSTVLCGE